MELSTSMQEAVSNLGCNHIFSECTSASVLICTGTPVSIDAVPPLSTILVHLPVHEISVSNYTARLIIPPAEIIRSGIATYAVVSFFPYGSIKCTIGNSGCDINLPTVSLLTGTTFTISNFSFSFPRRGHNERSFSRRLPVITGIESMKTERPEKRFSPAPDYLDLFW